MSRIVIRPASRPSLWTSSSFSTLCLLRMFSASSSEVLGRAVTRFSRVITASMRLLAERNFMSRRVRMPTSLPPSTTMGMPETLCSRMTRLAVSVDSPGGSVIGSVMMPFSDRLTFSTSRACTSMERFL